MTNHTETAVGDDQLRHPHLDQHPTAIADVTVYRLRAEDVDLWHVVVKHSTPNNPAGEIVRANYLAWSEDTPGGKLAHEAATTLLEWVMTS